MSELPTRAHVLLRTLTEAALYVLAHELAHAEQHERGLRLPMRERERGADAYAARTLRRYRRTG